MFTTGLRVYCTRIFQEVYFSKSYFVDFVARIVLDVNLISLCTVSEFY